MIYKTTQKALSFLVTVSLVLCLFLPGSRVQATADITDSGSCGENLTWTLDSNGTLTISGTGSMSFSGSSPWQSKETIKKVIVGEGVTDIEKYAFNCCSNLTSVSFPSTLQAIKDYAFYGCAIPSVEFPASLTMIGMRAFGKRDYSSAYLRSIKIPSAATQIGRDAFFGCLCKTAGPIGGGYDYEFAWTESIPDNAFSHCMSMTSITIPDTVKALGEDSFFECSVTSLLLPSSLETIGVDAFAASDLNSVTIPKNVTLIKARAFQTRKLTKVYFEGPAPTFEDNGDPKYLAPFAGATLDAYYPCNTPSWTVSAMRSAGGSVTWTRQHHFDGDVCTDCGQHGEDRYPELLMSISRTQIEVGNTLQVTITGADAAGLTWWTGNTAKAKVSSSGVVTAKSQGNTWLYVKSLDGREAKALLMITDTSALTLDEEVKWVKHNESVIMNVEHANGQALTWSVGNKSIATVDGNGTVTGVGIGNTWLYVKAADGRSTKCLLKVRGEAIKITYCGEALDQVFIPVNRSTKLDCENAGTLEVKWRTGNQSIAKVSDTGSLTPISCGNTWLYASIPGEQETRCLITIIRAPLSVRYTEKTVKVGKSFQFTPYSLNPEDSHLDVPWTWWVGNTSIASVDSTGTVTGLSAGNTWLHFSTADGSSGRCLLRIVE